MARIVDDADGYRVVYINEATMLEPYASAGSTLNLFTSWTETVGPGFYRSAVLTHATIVGAGFTLPATYGYTFHNALTNTLWVWPYVIGGTTATDKVTQPNYASEGQGMRFTTEHLDPDTIINAAYDYQYPSMSWRTSPTGILGHGYQEVFPQGTITVMFVSAAGDPQWASGAKATVVGGKCVSLTSSQPLKVDILSPAGDVLDTYDLDFYPGSGGSAAAPADVVDGAWSTRWIPPRDNDYDRLDKYVSGPVFLAANGGSVEFVYAGDCGGFAIRRTDDQHNPLGHMITAFGKRTRLPRHRLRQRQTF